MVSIKDTVFGKLTNAEVVDEFLHEHSKLRLYHLTDEELFIVVIESDVSNKLVCVTEDYNIAAALFNSNKEDWETEQ